MTQRTDTELKVFLEGTLEQYNALTDTEQAGSVFFDKEKHAVYANGECIIQSNIKDVTYNAGTTILTITPFTGMPIPIKLGIKAQLDILKTTLETWAGNRFLRYDVNTQGLSYIQKSNARINIGVKDAVDNLKSTDTIAPLSANQGRVLNESKVNTTDYSDADRDHLRGIESGAQKNRQITVNGEIVGTDANSQNITITGNLIRGINPEGGELAISLYGTYDSAQKKIFFRTDDTQDAEDLFEIDATDFIKDSFVKAGSYNADKQALILTLVTGKDNSGNDITEEVEIPVGALIDEYTAGDGIIVADNQFSANLGNGLQFDNTANNKKITLKLPTKSGLNLTSNGLAVNFGHGLNIDDNNEIVVDIDTDRGLKWTTKGKFGVDFTKAPVQSVNGQTGVVKIDVTPKVWSF